MDGIHLGYTVKRYSEDTIESIEYDVSTYAKARAVAEEFLDLSSANLKPRVVISKDIEVFVPTEEYDVVAVELD